MVLVFNNENNG